MKINGPTLDSSKRGQPRPWFLSYFAPKFREDGSMITHADGRPVLQRMRPHYESRAKALADIPRIRVQHESTGSGSFLFDRNAANDYESAKRLVGKVPLLEVARFWKRHHPDEPDRRLGELLGEFLADIELRLGRGRHYSDRKSRLNAFLVAGFKDRFSGSIERMEILEYLPPDDDQRTVFAEVSAGLNARTAHVFSKVIAARAKRHAQPVRLVDALWLATVVVESGDFRAFNENPAASFAAIVAMAESGFKHHDEMDGGLLDSLRRLTPDEAQALWWQLAMFIVARFLVRRGWHESINLEDYFLLKPPALITDVQSPADFDPCDSSPQKMVRLLVFCLPSEADQTARQFTEVEMRLLVALQATAQPIEFTQVCALSRPRPAESGDIGRPPFPFSEFLVGRLLDPDCSGALFALASQPRTEPVGKSVQSTFIDGLIAKLLRLTPWQSILLNILIAGVRIQPFGLRPDSNWWHPKELWRGLACKLDRRW